MAKVKDSSICPFLSHKYSSLRTRAFTLSELLIALAILGVIATFTIPKILTATQNNQYIAEAKEAASSFAQAYQSYQLSNTATATTTAGDLLPYFNYVKVDTSSVLNDQWGSTYPCTYSSYNCLVMHNGGIFLLWTGASYNFGGTGALNAIQVSFDPDGSGPTPIVWFYLYFNGKLASNSTISPGTIWGTTTNNPGQEAPWFHW